MTNVTCEFKDDFICGYKIEGFEGITWIRKEEELDVEPKGLKKFFNSN